MNALKQHLSGLVRGLALSLAVGCAHQPPFQPKDDYAQYPGYEPDIALHNIAGILEDNCSEYYVNTSGIGCKYTRCLRMEHGRSFNPATGETTSVTQCKDEWDVDTRLRWSDASTVTVVEQSKFTACVDVEGADNNAGPLTNCDFYIKRGEGNTQAYALKKSIEQYLMHR